MTTYMEAYAAQKEAARAAIVAMGVTCAVRAPASGPNNKLKRGKWTVDGRPATPAEARKLNDLEASRFFGSVIIEAQDGAWQGSRVDLEANG